MIQTKQDKKNYTIEYVNLSELLIIILKIQILKKNYIRQSFRELYKYLKSKKYFNFR